MSAEDPADIRREAIVASATEQVRALFETHFREITKAAEDSFIGDAEQQEPIAKAGFTIEWPALSQSIKVAVKVAWSVRYKDASEEILDPLQTDLGLPPVARRKKEAAP